MLFIHVQMHSKNNSSKFTYYEAVAKLRIFKYLTLKVKAKYVDDLAENW